jgi:hypothetical protein
MSRHRCLLLLLLVVAAAVPTRAQPDVATTLNDYCAHRIECAGDGQTVDDCLADQPDVQRAAGVDDPACTAFVELLLQHYACQTTLTCAALLDPAQGGCAGSSGALLEMLLTDGVGACFEGRPPVAAPEGWTCPAPYFNSGIANDCDCGCGAIDRDCTSAGVVGCAEDGCSADGCDFCYVAGDNVSCGDSDPTPPPPEPEPPPTPEPPPGSCAHSPRADGSALLGALVALAVRRRRGRR